MKGQVLDLMPSHRVHLLHVSLYDIRIDDDGEGCFHGRGLYAIREAAELDLVEAKQENPAAVLVQHTYFLDLTNQHDQAMLKKLRRVQEKEARKDRAYLQQKGR